MTTILHTRQAISGTNSQNPAADQYGEYADEEDRAMAELEEEMHRARGVTGVAGRGGASSGSYLPAGAVPRQNGVLSVHAKEFWFPECRNCACCKGFKHGCECCTAGVDTCAKGDCINAEFATQVATELASRTTDRPAPAVTSAPAPSKATPAAAPRAATGSHLPPGAVPRQNGVLSVHAKEFWFPECRNCACCKGFKHGCECCTAGVDTCAKGDCINAEFATQVATDLASRASDAPENGSNAASGGATAASTGTEHSSLNVRGPASSGHAAFNPSSAGGGAGAGAAASDICKFFASGGCRYGDSCRFKHVGTAPSAPAPGVAGAKQICPFFLNSQCQYGDSCRKSHDLLGATPGSYLPPGSSHH